MLIRDSQKHIAEAEHCLAAGYIERARAAFGLAAQLQHKFFSSLEPTRVQTKSVYGLSAASLYFRAHDLKNAARLSYEILAADWIDTCTATKLEELLTRIGNERWLENLGLTPAANPVSLILHGSQIGLGIAPPEVVDSKVATYWNILRRCAASVNHLPFTNTPYPAFEERYQALRSEAASGSYRVNLLLTTPQLSIDFNGDRSAAQPKEVIDLAFKFLNAAIASPDDPTLTAALVRDQRLRTVLLRLVRNLIPDGDAISEIEVRRDQEPRETAIVLYKHYRRIVNLHLKAQSAENTLTGANHGATESLSGILRIVDLVRMKVGLVVQGGSTIPLNLPDDFSDDVLRPCLNKKVVVTRFMPKNRKTWTVRDIELEQAVE